MTHTNETTAAVAATDDARRDRILSALSALAESRPGFDPNNYGDRASYDSDRRRALRQLNDARTLLAAVRWRTGITADALLNAARGGRVSITERGDGTVTADYCAGQYYCTEFRAGICRVLSSALWDYTRDHAMPEPTRHIKPEGAPENRACAIVARYGGLSAGDWLRRRFRDEFGAGLARRWFA